MVSKSRGRVYVGYLLGNVEGQYTNVNVMLLRRSFEDGATVLSLSTTLLFILLLLVVFLKHAHKSNLR